MHSQIDRRWARVSSDSLQQQVCHNTAQKMKFSEGK